MQNVASFNRYAAGISQLLLSFICMCVYRQEFLSLLGKTQVNEWIRTGGELLLAENTHTHCHAHTYTLAKDIHKLLGLSAKHSQCAYMLAETHTHRRAHTCLGRNPILSITIHIVLQYNRPFELLRNEASL